MEEGGGGSWKKEGDGMKCSDHVRYLYFRNSLSQCAPTF